MNSPITGEKMIVKRAWRKITYRKEVFDVLFHSWQCTSSGEEFEDEKFAELNYNQVVNQYREKHNIPFPEEIRAIREQYNLPAIKMSRVLGFGDNTYRQYESGEMPTQANARLIQMAADPNSFIEMIRLSDFHDEKQFVAAKMNAVELMKQKMEQGNTITDFFFWKRSRSRFTGYTLPDFKKFTEMALFFCTEKNIWKTKLNKLFFYADFAFYKYHGVSISGARYNPIDLGPVPDHFNSIYEFLVSEKILIVTYKAFSGGGIGEMYTSERDFNELLFSADELNMLCSVKERLKNVSTQEIIELSHNEKAWSENNHDKSQPINYNFAFELILF